MRQICLACCVKIFSFNFLDQNLSHDLISNPGHPQSQTHRVVLWVKCSQKSEEMMEKQPTKSPLSTENNKNVLENSK